MARYRKALPQLNGEVFLTDGGLETTLVFHDGFELPDFAAFDLFRREHGSAALRRYFSRYANIARDHGVARDEVKTEWGYFRRHRVGKLQKPPQSTQTSLRLCTRSSKCACTTPTRPSVSPP